MKIISKFKDYYDPLQTHDPSTGVYERKTEEVLVDWVGYGDARYAKEKEYSVKSGLLGFCGKLYPFVKYTKTGNPTEFIYSFDLFKVLRDYLLTIEYSRSTWYGWYGWYGLITVGKWTKIDNAKLWFEQDWQTLIDNKRNSRYEPNTGKRADYIDPSKIFLDYKVPCFVLEKTEESHKCGKFALILNPRLADYNFYRVVDTYSAYQEIEMFLNNQIVRRDDPYIEPVPDTIKAESHGFDKWSFRKVGKKCGKKH